MKYKAVRYKGDLELRISVDFIHAFEDATSEELEAALEFLAYSQLNLFAAARALRQAFDKTEREELAALLLEEIAA